MSKAKANTRVFIENDSVSVSYCYGPWYSNKLDNSWLWVLGSVKEMIDNGAPTDIIAISDRRTNREDHQESLTTNNRNEV